MILTVFVALVLPLNAQNYQYELDSNDFDTINYNIDSSGFLSDSIILSESLAIDTLKSTKRKKDALESEVLYNAEDSMIISLSEKKMYLYGNANVKYQNIELVAAHIEFDMAKQEVFAKGLTDSAGNEYGSPVFTQGSETFESKIIRYNFNSKKGFIYNIITPQGEGYLHSEKTKRLENGHIHIKNGKYTVCDLEHPHFYLALTKAIAIPDDKIVSGPGYLVVEDIPLPIGLPFGFFPNTQSRSSGLIIPTYGEENTRGFYLRNGGWYFALGEYIDLSITGDIYTMGSWATKISSGYIKRYKFSGSFSGDYAYNKFLTEASREYRFQWNHSQSPKANPTLAFSANVNLSSRSYDKNNATVTDEYLTNTKLSSVSLTKRWPGTPFSLAMSMNHSQNSKTGSVDINAPKGSFNMNQIYPLRKKAGGSKYRWYENIGISYSANFDNRLYTYDTVLSELAGSEELWSLMNNGFKHDIPLSINFKPINILNITPSLNYKGVLYTKSIRKSLSSDYIFGEQEVVTDTVYGLQYGHAIYPSMSVSLTPQIFGMFISKKEDSYIYAIRHVMKPSARFSFTPDLRGIMPNYYDTIFYTDPNDPGELREEIYSYFGDNSMHFYGTPIGNGKSALLSLGLNNNLEMKVRSGNDTTSEFKKISILDNLSFGTSYNPFADQFKWSDISMTAGTKLINNKIDIRFRSSFSPYDLNENGVKIDTFIYKKRGNKLVRMTNASINIGASFSSAKGKKTDNDQVPVQPEEESIQDNLLTDYYYGDYVDFSIPWSFSVNYIWSYSKPLLIRSFTHTVGLRGDFSITPKWKIGVNTGYDIFNKEMSFTNINLSRDLHCWNMTFHVVPFGTRRSYSFTIRANSSILKDLKIDKRQSWYDRF